MNHARVSCSALLIRYAYLFRGLHGPALKGLVERHAERLGGLCARLDEQLSTEQKRRFAFNRLEERGDGLILCWDLGDVWHPPIFEGRLAEEGADPTGALPCCIEPDPSRSILGERSGCLRLCG